MLRWRHLNWQIVLVFLFGFFIAQNAIAKPLAVNTENVGISKTLLEVHVNQQKTNQVVFFLQTSDGKLLASKKDFATWRVRLPSNLKSFTYENERYYALDDIPETKYTIDPKRMRATINFPGKLFSKNGINLNQNKFPTPREPSLGAFLNYDILAENSGDNWGDSFNSVNLSGLFSAHVFDGFGLISSDFVTHRNDDDNNDKSTGTIRLNSSWTLDNPSKMRSIVMGDSFSSVGMWGRSVDFGGIHIGRNFATQPRFVRFALPSTKGIATLPSAIDLYVNNTLVSKQNVLSGPFDIDHIPVITGAGDINIVTTDLLGRQQITNIPYYVSGSILKPGLHDYSIDMGFVRENYATKSNDYGQFMATVTDRVGLTNHLTGEWRVEAMRKMQTVGVGSSLLVSNVGVFNAALAVSRSDNYHFGELVSLGFQRHAFSGINYGITTQIAGKQFRQIGLPDDKLIPSFEGQLFLGIPLHKQGSISLSYIEKNERGTDAVNSHLFSVGYSRNLGKNWYLNVSALTNVTGKSRKACFITLSRALGHQTSTSLRSSVEQGHVQGTAQLIKGLPLGSGWGYNISVAEGHQQNYQASLSGQTTTGKYTASAAQLNGDKGYRLEASGAVAALGGHVYLRRSVSDSFAVAKIPGYKNVRVYDRNQLVGKTNKYGDIFIPNLLPYDDNLISINPNDLPLSAKIEATKMHAVPYRHTGLIIKFPVEPSYDALLRLVDKSGKIVPAGALVTPITQTKDGKTFPVGNDGAVYLTGLKSGPNKMQAKWDDTLCNFVINYHQTTAPLPKLGNIICSKRE